MSSGSYYEEEMPSGGHHSPTAFIFLVNSHSKKSLFLLTMGLAGRLPSIHHHHGAGWALTRQKNTTKNFALLTSGMGVTGEILIHKSPPVKLGDLLYHTKTLSSGFGMKNR